jgi:hypothetical protein
MVFGAVSRKSGYGVALHGPGALRTFSTKSGLIRSPEVISQTL